MSIVPPPQSTTMYRVPIDHQYNIARVSTIIVVVGLVLQYNAARKIARHCNLKAARRRASRSGLMSIVPIRYVMLASRANSIIGQKLYVCLTVSVCVLTRVAQIITATLEDL